MKLIIQTVIINSLIMWSLAIIILPDSLDKIIPGSYIVTLQDNENLSDFINNIKLPRNDGSASPLQPRVKHVYGIALNGFAANLDQSWLTHLDSLSQVKSISYDQIVTTQAVETQTNATWGLQRISQNGVVSSTTGPYNYKYDANTAAPCAVKVYVIDTGINVNHDEFLTNGYRRAFFGPNFVDGVSDSTDDNGHGTHCAGTVGGKTYGVAKNACIIGCKVLDSSGSGSTSGIIKGIDHACNESMADTNSKCVISMSLGGLLQPSFNDAVNNAVTKCGCVVAVAAGNSGTNACLTSPSSADKAITVAASDSKDKAASFTNCGQCVDVFAPGVDILSAWIGSNTATNTISGTSMATPHVAGLAAYYLGLSQYRNANITEIIINKSVRNQVSIGLLKCLVTGTTPNRLARNDV